MRMLSPSLQVSRQIREHIVNGGRKPIWQQVMAASVSKAHEP
jgi:hypothetical protein